MCKANGWRRLATVVAGLLLLGLVGPFWADDVKGGGRDARAVDKAIHAGLRDAINQGATLFNDYGDYAGSYRTFHGALLSVKPLLAQHPQLQKTIDEGLARAERNPRLPARAWILRKVLDEVRATLVPPEKGQKEEKKAEEKKKEEKKPEEKKPEEKKKMDKKKVEKKPEEKKPEEKKPEEKKPEEKKKTEKKPEEKKPEEKKKEEKKPEDKKTEDKKPEEKKTGDKKTEDKKPEEKKKEEGKAGEEKKTEPEKKAVEKKKEEKKKGTDKKAEFIDLKSARLEALPAVQPETSLTAGREESAWLARRLWARKTEG